VRFVPIALLATACQAASGAVSFSPPIAAPADDGVRIRQASRPYVETAPAATTASSAIVRAPARVTFRDGAMAQVGAPVAGRVVAVHVQPGDRVKAGAPLITLSSPDAAATRAQLAAAIAARQLAADDAARQESMRESGVGVEAERTAARARLTQADAELARARAATVFLGSGDGPEVVVRAPIAGNVLTRRASVGLSVEPGAEPLVELGDPSALWVVADVFERDLGQVKPGAEVDVELATQAQPARGRVTAVGAMLTELRAAPVYIALDEQPPVRAGTFARATIHSAGAPVVVLPAAAVLVKDGRRTLVYVQKEPDLYVAREVAVTQAVDGKVTVLAGLRPGEPVVVKGALLLDGTAEQLL
jgi:membrane fusion protein, heavy metal efflux system